MKKKDITETIKQQADVLAMNGCKKELRALLLVAQGLAASAGAGVMEGPCPCPECLTPQGCNEDCVRENCP